jgi:alanine racemase
VGFLKDRLQAGARLLAAVKANAYGHGATACDQAALNTGAYGVAVATAEEAMALRDAGIAQTILVDGAALFPRSG